MSAENMKFPPLSKKEVRKHLRELKTCYAGVYRASKQALPSPDVLWTRFLRICRKEKVSFLKLSGTMALASAKAGTKATGEAFWHQVIGSYCRSLDEVKAMGFPKFFARETHPYFKALSKAFSRSNKSSTERLLGE